MRSPVMFQVAYHRNEDDDPLFLPVLPPPTLAAPSDIDEWFEQMAAERAVAARIVCNETVIEHREFPPPPFPAERVFMVYHPRYAMTPFPTTVTGMREKFGGRSDVFCETRNGMVAVNASGAEYIAMPVQQFRMAVAGLAPPGAPVCRPGDAIPLDKTYVHIARHYRVGHASLPDRSAIIPRRETRVVIPYINGRPLWDTRMIASFAERSETEAIAAAQRAIGLIRTPDYDPIGHFRRLTDHGEEIDDEGTS